MTMTVNSSRAYAAIRAHRTMVANTLAAVTNPVARGALQAALARYDAELASAPAKPVEASADRRLAAYRAHRTMLLGKIKGTRGKARTEIKTRLAHYDALLAA